MKNVEIFWTGGFDSTFRVVQLSRLPVALQPVYLTGINMRKSESFELNAIKKIYDLLKAKKETIARLLPLKVVYNEKNPPQSKDPAFIYEPRPRDHAVAEAYRRLYIKLMDDQKREALAQGRGVLNAVNVPMFLTSQNQECAEYANTRDFVEIGFSRQDNPYKLICFFAKGALTEIDDGICTSYHLEKSLCPPDVYKLFGHFRFPLIVNYATKSEFMRDYIAMGYEDVMNLTWFCYEPIDGEPCGQCWTCIHTYRDGITNRFSVAALERYHKREAEFASEK